MLPQTNATLTSITRTKAGYTEDYDRDAGGSSSVWSGSVDAYVQRKVTSTFDNGGNLRRVVAVTMFVSEDLPLEVEPGDVVLYFVGDTNEPTAMAGIVQNLTDPAYMATVPDYWKIPLQDTNVP